MPLPAEVRLYDYLFAKPDPYEVPEGGDWRQNLNPNSLEVLPQCWLEPSLAEARPATVSSSSGWAISPSTTIPSPAAWSSTAP